MHVTTAGFHNRMSGMGFLLIGHQILVHVSLCALRRCCCEIYTYVGRLRGITGNVVHSLTTYLHSFVEAI